MWPVRADHAARPTHRPPLQRSDLLAIEPEHMLEIRRISRKITGHSSDHHDRAVSFCRAEWYDGMVILRASRGLPPFDGVRARERAAFVEDDTVGRKASCERASVPRLLRGEVRGDGLRQVDGHEGKSSIGE